MDTSHSSVQVSGRYSSAFEKSGYYNPDIAYLNAGAAGTDILRMLPPIIEAATSYQMQQELEGTAQLFQYGVEQGNWQFRSFLATFLSEKYGEHVDCDDLFLTGGASCGLWMILSFIFSRCKVVFIEDPSYFVAINVFKDYEKTIIPVKMDQDGIIVEDLEEKLERHLHKIPSTCELPLEALLYIIPVYHNPTGATLSKVRCQKVIELARKFGVTVFCDDVYNLLHYDNSPTCPRRLFAFDNKSDIAYVGNVISNCTFSKILGPGLRVGWLEAPKWVVEKLQNSGVLKSGGGLNTYTAGIITSLIALGKMDTHLKTVRSIYKETKKKGCQWLFISHEIVLIDDVIKHLESHTGSAILKFEPFVLHTQCSTLENAKTLLRFGIQAGFKNSGISIGKSGKIIVALRNTLSLEVPLSLEGKLLVTYEYISYVVNICNEKMLDNWKRIDRFYTDLQSINNVSVKKTPPDKGRKCKANGIDESRVCNKICDKDQEVFCEGLSNLLFINDE